MIVWLNGHLEEESNARIAPSDRGFLLGDGLFETILVRNGKPVFLTKHLARLAQGAATLGFKAPLPPAEMQRAISELLTANGFSKAPRAALRLTLTRGSGPRGLAPPNETTPTMLITCFLSQAPTQSVSAITSSICRNEFSPTAQLKALPYLDQILAKQEATKAGADDALLYNTKGKIVCATTANIFLWDSDTLITPPLADGCLDGITRRTLLGIARDKGIDCYEESITPSTLACINSGFLTNSLVGIQSLSTVDGRPFKEHHHIPSLRKALAKAEGANI